MKTTELFNIIISCLGDLFSIHPPKPVNGMRCIIQSANFDTRVKIRVDIRTLCGKSGPQIVFPLKVWCINMVHEIASVTQMKPAQ